MRWAQLPDYQRATGGRLYGLLLSGDVVALAVLAEALVLALVLLAVPWLRTRACAGSRRRTMPAMARPVPPGRWWHTTWPWAGLHPAGADADPAPHRGAGRPGGELQGGARRTAGVVCSRGLLSERIAPPRTWLAVAAVAGVVLAYAAAGPALLTLLLGLPRIPRVACIVVSLAPLGAVLGMAFPLGLRLLAPAAASRALAWAANGCASVVGAVASTLLAVSQGITALGLVAAASYAVAALVAALGARRRR